MWVNKNLLIDMAQHDREELNLKQHRCENIKHRTFPPIRESHSYEKMLNKINPLCLCINDSKSKIKTSDHVNKPSQFSSNQ